MPQDYTIDNRLGEHTETRQVGYHPNGDKDSWVILCTVKRARGPITETRTVTYSAWGPVVSSDEPKDNE